jgi:multidrug efflux pump subunit AcrA (membrane-fusion protein)
MSATARIEVDRIDETFIVPASAVVERDGSHCVFVVSGGQLEQRSVTVLRRGRERVAIASGLTEGEHVALQPPGITGGAS